MAGGRKVAQSSAACWLLCAKRDPWRSKANAQRQTVMKASKNLDKFSERSMHDGLHRWAHCNERNQDDGRGQDTRQNLRAEKVIPVW